MKIPDRNQPLESEPNIRWIQEHLESAMSEIRELRAWRDTVVAQFGSTAGEQTTTNNTLEEYRLLLLALQGREGVPPGGWRGSVLVRDVDENLQWTTPVGSIVPRYIVYLEPGNPRYDVPLIGSATTSAAAKKLLPAPLFEDDGRTMDWPISWGDEWEDLTSFELASNNLPISLTAYLYPTEAGQDFKVIVPIASRGAPWSIVHVHNDGDVAADLTMWFANSAAFYGDTGVPVPAVRSLAPGEALVWKLDEAHDQGVARVTPFKSGSAATDQYYWANVAATRDSKEFTAFGDDLVPVASVPIRHGRMDSPRIGKVRATVSPAPTTGGVTVDVKLNGVSILSTPLVVPAGSTSAEVVPSVTNFTSSFFGTAVLWGPTVDLVFEVVSNGSSTPVTSLTGQVFYG